MQFTLRFDPAHDLAHARERVAEDDAGKWDRLVPRRQIKCWNGWLALPETVLLPLRDKASRSFAAVPDAHPLGYGAALPKARHSYRLPAPLPARLAGHPA